ncbi:hypothetical protein OHC33_003903 [Knufia fluminis]|uniref:Uncharacterized protein n=1 Tax=Knufia fluminis TaxID=191047 RepID=A0AAN8ENB2_9EURO|nr:hypothetical protein OHC33_003903 [Knufia fluminis]
MGTCSLHPVVHEWAQSRISDDQKMVFWLKCTLHLLSCCASSELMQSDPKSRMTILSHIDSCSDLIAKRALSIFQTRRGADQAETFACLYEANGSWQKALALLKIIARFRLKELGQWNEDYLRTQRSISRCYWNLFEVKSALDIQVDILRSRWYLRPSLLDWRHVLRPRHMSYCIALDDLTQTLWLIGLRDKSRQTGQRAVQCLSRKLDENDPRLWNAMFNLGRTLRHLVDLDTAHNLLSRVVRKRKVQFGLDDPDTLMARNELGMSFWARRQRLDIAERLVANVLKARRSVLGRDHAYTL